MVHYVLEKLEHSFIRPLLQILDMLEEYQATGNIDTIFSQSSAAARLHQGIVEKVGVSNFHHLESLVHDTVGNITGDFSSEDLDHIFDFGARVRAVQDLSDEHHTGTYASQHHFLHLFEMIYPLYLTAMVSEDLYYLRVGFQQRRRVEKRRNAIIYCWVPTTEAC